MSQGLWEDLIEPFSNTCILYNEYAQKVNELATALKQLQENPEALSSDTVAAIGTLLAALASLQTSNNAPNLAGTESTDIDNTVAVITKWMNEDTSVSDADVLSSIGMIGDFNIQQDSNLSTQFSTALSYVVAVIQGLQQKVQYQLCDAERGEDPPLSFYAIFSDAILGNGGPGGVNQKNPTSKPGARGTNGEEGSILARNLAFDGRATDLAVWILTYMIILIPPLMFVGPSSVLLPRSMSDALKQGRCTILQQQFSKLEICCSVLSATSQTPFIRA